jgi:hypothetical protein
MLNLQDIINKKINYNVPFKDIAIKLSQMREERKE